MPFAEARVVTGIPRHSFRTLDRLKAQGIPGELITLSGKTIRRCTACNGCRESKEWTCPAIQDDDFAPIMQAMLRADIIVVGSPVYFGSAAPELMALRDRAGYVAGANGKLFSRKIGGPIAVARRAGHNFTYAQLLLWYMINDMVVPGSTYWNVALAREPGAVMQDTEALETIDHFADNLAWLAKKLD